MQGVIGLAIGFLLGGAVSKLVSSFVEDIVNPVLGIFFGRADDLSSYSTWIGASEIRWGSFLSMLIDFAVIAAIVYFGFKGLGLERIDIKKEAQAELKKIKKM
jgi:large conductance mechanosensitive channel